MKKGDKVTFWTNHEMKVVAMLSKNWQGPFEIQRKSEREFDLTIQGRSKELGCQFSAWLVLSAIRDLLPWTSPQIANMTDYPEMAKEGDWSGVRDTDEAKLWDIFYEHIVGNLAK